MFDEEEEEKVQPEPVNISEQSKDPKEIDWQSPVLSPQSISMNDMGNSTLINSVSNSRLDKTDDTPVFMKETSDNLDPFDQTKRALSSSLEGSSLEKSGDLTNEIPSDLIDDSEKEKIIANILEKSVEEDPTD